jgi:integrase
MQQMTVSAFLGRYLEEKRVFLKFPGVLQSVFNSISIQLGENRLVDLNGPMVYSYVQARLRKGLKPSTINHELAALSAAVNHAVRKWGYDLQNPVRHQWLRQGELRLRYLETHEARRLLHHAYQIRPDLGAFVRLALYTGCRKTEMLTLQWHHVNMKDGYFVLRPENTKAGRRRLVPLNSNARKALDQQRKRTKGDWVFPAASAKGRITTTFNWLFPKAVRAAGIEDFRIHDLRHTFASWLVSEGVELAKVRDLLGHKSIQMTERYAHLMPGRLRDAVIVLDRLGVD